MSDHESTIPPALFTEISSWLKDASGIVLAPEKSYLLENRLTPVASNFGFPTVLDLLWALSEEKLTSEIQTAIIDALTTNESLFFRDIKPFDYLISHIMPSFVSAGITSPRIWSAACASGQEIFSVAMKLQEASLLQHAVLDASDLSATVVARARSGLYSQFEVQRGLPITMLMKYFQQLSDQRWQIKESIRERVRFFDHNLLSPPQHTSYHLILCRYALIYFDEATREHVLTQLIDVLECGGYLMLGSSEALKAPDHYGLLPAKDAPQGIFQKR